MAGRGQKKPHCLCYHSLKTGGFSYSFPLSISLSFCPIPFLLFCLSPTPHLLHHMFPSLIKNRGLSYSTVKKCHSVWGQCPDSCVFWGGLRAVYHWGGLLLLFFYGVSSLFVVLAFLGLQQTLTPSIMLSMAMNDTLNCWGEIFF